MNQNVYSYMSAVIRCVREDADVAHAAALRGEQYAAPDSQITLQEHGYRVTISKMSSSTAASLTKGAPASFFSVNEGRLRRPWKTRGGKRLRPADLIEAIRPGWPGFKVLCDTFDTHNEGLSSWLKQCTAMGLLARCGKGYVVTENAAEVTR
jgi:hypothetical protein